MRLKQAISDATSRLSPQSATPRLDAELLLGHLLARDRAWLRAFDDTCLDGDVLAAFDALIARRAAGEPVAYLLGRQEFWSLPLKAAVHTLIPRPETELLVEVALDIAPAATTHVLDLGTGTGAIALALKHERPAWQITAVDRIPEAVALARENADTLGLPMEVLLSCWFDALASRRFHVIVSNPPYIDEADPHLRGDGVRFEPLSALVAGRQGLADLQLIIAGAPAHLFPGGVLAVEHGYSQGEAVAALFRQAGFAGVRTCNDLSGQPRITCGQYNS